MLASCVRPMGVSMPDMPRAVECVSAALFLARFACMWYLSPLTATQPASLGVFVPSLAVSAYPSPISLFALDFRALVNAKTTTTTVGVRVIRGYSKEKEEAPTGSA